MHCSFRALALGFSLLISASLCACLPTRVSGSAHFPGCSIPVFDTSADAAHSMLRPYLDEVASITGMRFEWVGTKVEARYGLVIAPIPRGTAADVMGSYSETYHGTDGDGNYVVWGSVISLRPNTSAGIRRHEIGHLFNLAHNNSSALMRPAPDGNATWSVTERASMRAMATRSGCS